MESVSTIVIPTPLGPLAVSGTETKIVALTFDSVEPEVASGGGGGSGGLLAVAREQIEEYFAGGRREFDLLLEQPGTEFQQRVWRELRAIPFGETISYRELAERVGNPAALRAVGAADGRNNLVIAVPCHRVIGSDGSLTGFSSGMERKRWLLDHEAGVVGATLWGEVINSQ